MSVLPSISNLWTGISVRHWTMWIWFRSWAVQSSSKTHMHLYLLPLLHTHFPLMLLFTEGEITSAFHRNTDYWYISQHRLYSVIFWVFPWRSIIWKWPSSFSSKFNFHLKPYFLMRIFQQKYSLSEANIVSYSAVTTHLSVLPFLKPVSFPIPTHFGFQHGLKVHG